MGIQLKRTLAWVIAVCLLIVSLPEYLGTSVRYARAAEQTASQKGTVQQGQTGQKKDGLRGAAETGGSTVAFSKESGTYAEAFDLELTCGAGVASGTSIYFTTDGSDPSDTANEARQRYTPGSIHIADRKGDPNVLSDIDPILFDATNVTASADGKSFESTVEKPSDEDVDKCTVIKAAAQFPDGTCSEVTTNTYFIGDMADHIEGIRQSCEAAGMDLSVMSISMDASDLFDSTKGIYVKGDVFNQALEEYLADGGRINEWSAVDTSRGMDANYKQKGRTWERETHIDYFESNGTETSCKLQQDCGIRIQGNYSRSDYQKSFRLYARADYGEKNFKYGFWDQAKDDNGNVIRKYKKIVLRNGGNCAFTTKFSDAYWQSLMEGIDCDRQSARPCVVYLNGEYWGVYILQDDFCGAYFENKHGLDKDSILIYKGDAEANRTLGYKLDEGELPEGVTNEDYYFEDLEKFMREHSDLSDPADYEAFCQLVDKDSVLDYFATQVWINNKWDWPGKNWSMWKSTIIDPTNPYADGKWRFLIYDVEFGGISGSDDSSSNTVRESKLLSTGTADKGDVNWDKPNVRCFALFMTNPEFREAFKTRLSGFSDTMFERTLLLERAEQFKNIYQPILDQFFNRFPTLWNGKKKTADMVINGNGWDTYGTLANIVAFAKKRANSISSITNWIDKQYPSSATPTPKPTDDPAPTTAPDEPKPANTPVPSSTPLSPGTGNSNEPITITLADGAKKIVQLDASGKVVSTKYQVEGVTYLLKSDKTLAYSVDNNKNMKKKSSCVILDQVVAGGNRYKVTEIEAGALRDLKKLKSVIIGENVKTIGKNAFRGCKKLKKITFLGKKVKKIGNKAFYGIAKKAKFICPKAKRKAYQKLIKKSGVNLKKTKIKVTGFKQTNAKGKTDTPIENQNNVLPITVSDQTTASSLKRSQNNRKTLAAERSRSAAAASITMSSLAKEDGSFQNAVSGAVVTIDSAEELKLLSQYTKEKHRTAGVTFLQTAEIDGTGVTMESIGVRYCKSAVSEYGEEYLESEDFAFQGTYDGDGHSIRNIKIAVNKSDADRYYMALFGVTEEASLQNIDLESIDFVDADTGEPFAFTDNMIIYMAGIAAGMQGDGGGITGCTNHADLTVYGQNVNVAGIVADCRVPKVEDCHNAGNITAEVSAAGEEESDINAHGIVVDSYYAVSRCTNSGTIQSDGNASGIVNYVDDVLSDCENMGKVVGKKQAAGISVNLDYSVTRCKNSGDISSDGIAAGLVAVPYGGILNSENTGAVAGGEYAGGIAGKAYYFTEVSAVKNSGKITGQKIAGGIMAYAANGSISNAQNLADVHGDQVAGGVAGFLLNLNMGNVWNYGTISGASQLGGIAGSADRKIFGSNVDDDAQEEDFASSYFNCVNVGTVDGGTEMGALIGHSVSKDQLSKCYYLNETKLPASGSDASLDAETVSADQYITQDFIDQLNKNLSEARGAVLLLMKYDTEGKLQWQPRIALSLFGVSGENDDETDK
ncbi:MAG: CotH kinase family protein, partial [Lachnospiraceae bacterium]|nr:CotH kinase family protein [Lachnospiraceae bacterium]